MEKVICIKCWVLKDKIEFYKHKGTKDWILHKCKNCVKEYSRSNRSKEADKKRYYNNSRRWLYMCYRWINDRVNWISNNWHYKKRWIKNLWTSFDEFYSDMLKKFEEHKKQYWISNTTIDRIDNNYHYCKENTRWATYIDQANNTRSNRIETHNWFTWTLSEICRKYNVNYGLVHSRLDKGRSMKRAIEK